MEEPRDIKWWPLAVIAGMLVLWGLFLGLGAYLQWGADQPDRDPRRFWIVFGCVLGFLAFWGIALLGRARRKPRAKDQ